MQILLKIVSFNTPVEDLITVYIMNVRSILESCQVWHSMLTLENIEDLEQVQKSALKIILQDKHSTNEEALEKLMLSKLSDSREKLCVKFTICVAKNELTADLFPPIQLEPIQEARKSTT